jgi:hypothetical protein
VETLGWDWLILYTPDVIPAPAGIQGGFNRSSQHSDHVWLIWRNSSRVSAGVFHPRVFRGLVLSARATASR